MNEQNKANQEEFICACNGLKCEGICRDTHLYRQRGAWAQNEKIKGRCPEAIEKKRQL